MQMKTVLHGWCIVEALKYSFNMEMTPHDIISFVFHISTREYSKQWSHWTFSENQLNYNIGCYTDAISKPVFVGGFNSWSIPEIP